MSATFRMWIQRMRGLFRKEQMDRELDDELKSHLEIHVADNLRAGMSAVEARRKVLIKLGGVEQTKNSFRDGRGIPILEALVQVQDRIWSVDKNQPIIAIKTVEAQIAEVNATSGAQSILLGIFGGLGFMLALVGVYGVMSYLVSLQTREIGIRMAQGADRDQVLRSVITHGLKLTLSGVIIGVLSGLALTRFMSSILFGISATDPLTFAGVATVLSIIALAACYVPARRATRVDPMIALRYE